MEKILEIIAKIEQEAAKLKKGPRPAPSTNEIATLEGRGVDADD